jgi:ArsR family transcriptional regulator
MYIHIGIMRNHPYLDNMENLFLGLADKTRLRILNLIRDDEVCVWFFTEVLGESQPKISRHLAYLRNAGIVSARRDGKWIFYSITPADEPARRILLDVLDSLSATPGMRREYESLLEMYASPAEQEVIAPPKEEYIQYEESTKEEYVEYREREEIETYLL